MLNVRNSLFGFVAAVALFAAACGSDSGSSVTPAGTVGETGSAAVTAAGGGTVALASGTAQVIIPPGALSADTTITVETLDTAGMAEESRLGSWVVEFGPDGTQFSTPVAISLKTGGATPSGKKAVLAYLDGDKWTEVTGSVEAGGMVTASVTHFSKYVIYFKDNKVIIENGDAVCKDLNFSPCGGSVEGTWTVESYCLATREIGSDGPFENVPACQNGNSSYVMDIEWTGEVTFGADGAYTSNFGTILSIRMELKDTCLNGLSQGQMSPSAMCDQIGTSMVKDGDTVDVSYSGGVCHIVAPQDTNPGEVETGTYQVVGNTITFNNGGSEHGGDFCVDGDMTYVDIVQSDDTNDDGVEETYHDILVLKRK